MIFATCQLQEKGQEMRTHLYTTFVDLTKAFDMVYRDGLWKVMQKFGCPEQFTHMVHQLHDRMTARVTDNGMVSEAFTVTNGVKQGCVLAPTLFSPMFSAMLMDAYSDEQPGIRIAYRTDGHLLNSRHMKASTRVSTTTVNDWLFADDCALNTVTEEEMQRSMILFDAGCNDFGLTISTAKTVVMHQPPPSAEYIAPRINVNGAQLKKVETFAYLGCTLSHNTRIDDEVAQRISKDSQAFGRLQSSMRHRHDRQDVVLTKAIPGADGCTDHHLVISKMRLRLPPRMRPQSKRPKGKLNTALLNMPAHHLHFSNELANRLAGRRRGHLRRELLVSAEEHHPIHRPECPWPRTSSAPRLVKVKVEGGWFKFEDKGILEF
ncbi:unnamed protein product [Schistocephalus solidus]|uniref:Reverse transcriptase domain-containing protein n=1 Tax=Schistocephalus solidus TaxID=70667 RepID=A0A183SA32_SCHSO|nr:unnamed protein product [Schistocephalus solidus]